MAGIDCLTDDFHMFSVHVGRFLNMIVTVCASVGSDHRIKICNRRATQRCNVSSFFYAKICSLLARRRSSQPVQRVYWPENVIDWLGKWRPTCIMRHARGQKLQSFRRKWPFYMDLYSMVATITRQLWIERDIHRRSSL